MKLFAYHSRSTLGTDTVNAALTSYMRFFMPALWIGANAVPAWTGAGFVTAAAAASLPLASASLTATLTESIA